MFCSPASLNGEVCTDGASAAFFARAGCTWKFGHFFYEPFVSSSSAFAVWVLLEKIFCQPSMTQLWVIDARSLDSQVPCHQLFSVTAVASPVWSDHTHIKLRPKQQPTTTNNNQQQPTTTNNNQQQPTTTNSNQQHPTAPNSTQQQPTTTNNNQQQQPTTTNNNQQQPTTPNQQQPTTTTTNTNNQHQQPTPTTNTNNQHQQPTPTTTTNNQQPTPTTNNKAGVVCCLPTCAKGSSIHVTGNFGV